ncbi:hypothetical protein [Glycomyces paridis]|uniref:Uncharacterized protein n=1 Tax=Glycomyces paridis TaxID=2126555 RepID=A0A4S8P0F6_9ACTN|nr:hypothetical protein [Glycomyces paridis]THV23497.1 hypothetical protein E9998_23155 [Glycomyces paridis]
MHQTPSQTRSAPPPTTRVVPPSATTRHLCAGALTDRVYRKQILDTVYHSPERAVAPNHGADGARVLAHAKAAHGLEVARHAVAAAILGCMALTVLNTAVPPGFLLALVVWGLIGLAVHSAVDHDLFGGIGPIPLLVAAGAFAALFFVGPVLQAVQSAGTSSGFGSTTTAETPSSTAGATLMVLWLIALAVANTSFDVMRAKRINALADNEDRPLSDARIDEVRRVQSSNEVVNYSPYRHPFVGAGKRIATWQFAMPLRPDGAPSEEDWPSFDTAALNAHIRGAVAELAADRGHSRHLPGLELSDQVYISGADTTFPAHTLGDLTRMRLPDTFGGVQADPTGPIRHFLRCQAVSWDGELVTTIFIHTAIQGQTLYMEFHSFSLPPTKEEYHIFGRGSIDSDTRVGIAAATGLTGVPLAIVAAPIGAAKAAIAAIRNRHSAAGRGSDDSGALASIRELGSDAKPHHYFQSRDSVKYTEILEAQLLESVKGFLRGRVDLQQLDGFAQTIVNNGIVNYGQVNAGAVGKGATAVVGAVGNNARGSAAK